MPIQVTCPGCKATFTVSDKFAGKQGPCPKCKAVITVPKQEAVTIHAPEEPPAKGGATATVSQAGRNLTPKPIRRQETNITARRIVLTIVAIAAAIAGAWFAGPFLAGDSITTLALRTVALLIVSVPIVIAGYAILRDEELEPFTGRSLWLRALCCALAYAALWGVYHFVPPTATRSSYSYLVIAPPFVLVGGGVALASFDFDYGTGTLHYSFYLLLTFALGYLAGMPMPWGP
ncbi:MAG TPA: hypothetical protein VHZ24_01985 [Pirellulales bacterium]|jgi:hypothetical protein|nr:hypothetical protein [Pirellulales bacterium]